MSSLLKTVRSKVSGDRARHEEEGFNLDLTYVVPRIIGKLNGAFAICVCCVGKKKKKKKI
jgi:hypothetical protein